MSPERETSEVPSPDWDAAPVCGVETMSFSELKDLAAAVSNEVKVVSNEDQADEDTDEDSE